MGDGTAQKGVWQALEDQIRRFMRLQDAERIAFAAGDLEGMADRWQQRARQFQCLRQRLEEVAATGGAQAHPKRYTGIQRLMQELFEGEKTLAVEVARCRQLLADRLAALRIGKKTLRGYQQMPPGSARPRFLSSRT